MCFSNPSSLRRDAATLKSKDWLFSVLETTDSLHAASSKVVSSGRQQALAWYVLHAPSMEVPLSWIVEVLLTNESSNGYQGAPSSSRVTA